MDVRSSRDRRPRRGRPTALALIGLAAACVSLVAQAPATQSSTAPAAPSAAPAPAAGGQAAPPRRSGVPIRDDRASWGDFSPRPPVKALTPEEQAKRFILPPGYRLELVLSEPDIVAPTAITFDGNGRMFVVEMRSYMLDADARDEFEPVSRISMHESTKGDGRFDKHTVFLGGQVLPRMAVPLDDSILTMETHTNDIYRYWDDNKDGVADRKALFFSGAGRRGNLEHQPSGFIWAMDNWIYSTYNAFRLRWTPGGVRTGPTAPNGGQWGLTQDDYGKVWFVDAGGERGPINFQAPIHYGGFNVPDQFEEDFEVTWPVIGLGDMEGGRLRVRMPVGTLNHFTATCGQDVYRGDRLPADLRGDLLFAEPVGRLIRRARIEVDQGLTTLKNVYPQSEFILSTDPLFRPVNMATAPDGTIYIADMYQGIVQESEWTRPGSYLRKKIEQYGMERVVGHGRIWRLVHEDQQPGTVQPRMLEETSAQLVAHLGHANGWWRDTAQRLLVLKQDRSVVPALQELTRRGETLLARFHALWTLEGLDALDAALVREQMKDGNPQMRVQAIRASESLYKGGDQTFGADYRALTNDPDATVVIQALLTLNHLKAADIGPLVRAAQKTNKARGVQQIGDLILRPAFGGGGGFRGLTLQQRKTLEDGAATYAELCYSCHGSDGKGAAMAGAPAGTRLAPALAGSGRLQGHRDYAIKTLLHGMTGPIDGNTYAGVMVPMGSNSDEWIAAVVSYVRNSWGNSASFVTPEDVARVRKATPARSDFWTVEELERSLPRVVAPGPAWQATASHNAAIAPRAIAASGPSTWTTGTPQKAGMWFQVELPAAMALTELQFDSPGTIRWPERPAALPSGTGAAGSNGGAAQAARPAAPAAPPVPVAVPAFPRSYMVQTSLDGKTWSPPVARGEGFTTTTVVTFAPVRTRFIRITQTADVPEAGPWSIQRLRLYAPPAPAARTTGSEQAVR